MYLLDGILISQQKFNFCFYYIVDSLFYESITYLSDTLCLQKPR